MIDRYYLIADGRVWSTKDSSWVTEIEDLETIKAPDEQGMNSLQGLVAALKFYQLPYPMTFEEQKQAKLAEVMGKANVLNLQLKAKYSVWEVDSWPEQEAHAKLVVQGQKIPENSILYTILDGKNKSLPVEQQLTLQQLAEKVMQNVTQARGAATFILHQQNVLEEAVKVATTVEELNSIVVEYT